MTDPTSRLIRWRLKLAEYEYDVVYKPGKINDNADALSRNPTTFDVSNKLAESRQVLPLERIRELSSSEESLFTSSNKKSKKTPRETEETPKLVENNDTSDAPVSRSTSEVEADVIRSEISETENDYS